MEEIEDGGSSSNEVRFLFECRSERRTDSGVPDANGHYVPQELFVV